MDRRERDSFTATTPQDDLEYGEQACLETSREVFDKLHERFCYSPSPTRCGQTCGTPTRGN